MKQNEKARSESEKRFQDIFDHAPFGIFQSTLGGKLLRINTAFARIAGYESAPEMKAAITDVGDQLYVFPEERKKLIDSVLKVDGWVETEEDFLRKDGSIITVNLKLRAVRKEDGSVCCLEGFIENISERKQAEEAFKTLVLAAPIGIYILQGGKFKVINPGFQQITGFSEAQLLGRDSLDIVLPRYRKTVRTKAVEMLKGKSSTPYEFKILTRGKEIKWIMEAVTPMEYQGLRSTLGYFMDIDEHKRVEQALKRSEKKYRDLFQNAPIGVIQSSFAGKPLNVNPAFAQMLGYESPGEFTAGIANMSAQVYGDPNDREKLLDALLRNHVGVCGFESRFRRKDGSSITVNMHGRIIQNGDGTGGRLEVFAEDISERKKMELELYRINEELEERVRNRTLELDLKSKGLEETNTALKVLLQRREEDRREFEESILSNVKHSILPYIETMKKADLGREPAAYLTIVESHLGRITSSFVRKLSHEFLDLTATEIRIAGLIKEGKSTREIAELLQLSQNTVMTHRYRMRKKLRLIGKGINLISFLKSIDRQE